MTGKVIVPSKERLAEIWLDAEAAIKYLSHIGFVLRDDRSWAPPPKASQKYKLGDKARSALQYLVRIHGYDGLLTERQWQHRQETYGGREADMTEIERVDLHKIPDAGMIRFLWAEWKQPRSPFVVIRYSLDGSKDPEPLGLRLDLDKRAILDDVGDPKTSELVRAAAQAVWDVVMEYRERNRCHARY